jgi:hypothetical protein
MFVLGSVFGYTFRRQAGVTNDMLVETTVIIILLLVGGFMAWKSWTSGKLAMFRRQLTTMSRENEKMKVEVFNGETRMLDLSANGTMHTVKVRLIRDILYVVASDTYGEHATLYLQSDKESGARMEYSQIEEDGGPCLVLNVFRGGDLLNGLKLNYSEFRLSDINDFLLEVFGQLRTTSPSWWNDA